MRSKLLALIRLMFLKGSRMRNGVFEETYFKISFLLNLSPRKTGASSWQVFQNAQNSTT